MVIVIMGVSGSGKTTVGRSLALAVNGEFRDADDFHSPASIAKMARGIPLTDRDRDPWIATLRARIDEWRTAPHIVILACSALTTNIRRRLGLGREGVGLVHLEGDERLIEARMRAREHFMPPELLASQLELLERPEDALVLDASQPLDALIAEIRQAFAA
jgi:gluconokinase